MIVVIFCNKCKGFIKEVGKDKCNIHHKDYCVNCTQKEE